MQMYERLSHDELIRSPVVAFLSILKKGPDTFMPEKILFSINVSGPFFTSLLVIDLKALWSCRGHSCNLVDYIKCASLTRLLVG